MSGVKIKPLVWEDNTSDAVSLHRCKTPFGYWELFGCSTGAVISVEPFFTGEKNEFKTVEECKQFCQEQWVRRVRECLA